MFNKGKILRNSVLYAATFVIIIWIFVFVPLPSATTTFKLEDVFPYIGGTLVVFVVIVGLSIYLQMLVQYKKEVLRERARNMLHQNKLNQDD